ncbi:fumarylacetoacetate hydrolase family protein [Seohaeicola nanhaiensis]|uniref:Fumarylacetoacetate hydrolase family protein n=1 Tax=Seohaeicola nanhaiensis TaxID=1387282 RepID=A0ABV9KAM5_9RHOB
MKFLAYAEAGAEGLAVETEAGFRGLREGHPRFPGRLESLIAANRLEEAAVTLAKGDPVEADKVRFLPPLRMAGKFIAVGLNYRAHTAEGPYEQPDYPTLFARFASSFVAHNQPILRPRASVQLDYEGELVAVIGKTAKDVPVEEALDHVCGYSIFNDASVRDYQRRTPQWTPGKNFDGTGGFGPWFVTADALPPGCIGLTLETRLNGQSVQKAAIDDMVFPVADLVSIISAVMTLEPGDVIITGTPSGVGHARKPQLWMKDGDLCEVEISGIGVLTNPIRDA